MVKLSYGSTGVKEFQSLGAMTENVFSLRGQKCDIAQNQVIQIH